MINRVVLEGHLGATPQKYETPSNKIYTYISLPLANPYKRENEETEWMQCQVWNKTAEYVLNNAVVGDLITVDGRLRNTKYTDKKTGNTVYRTYVQIERLTLHRTGKRDNQNQNPNANSNNQSNFDSNNNNFSNRTVNSHPNSSNNPYSNPNHSSQQQGQQQSSIKTIDFDDDVLNQDFDPFSNVFGEDELKDM